MNTPTNRDLVWLRLAAWLAGLLACCATAQPARPPNLQFDMFVGFAGITPEAGWAPVLFEVKNDGPSFTGRVELDTAGYGGGSLRSLVVELPTGSLKRFLIPTFCDSRFAVNWSARLLDEHGRLRAETSIPPMQNRATAGWKAVLVGALARGPRGGPVFPSLPGRPPDLQPACASLQTATFPDNPIVLERLQAIYLNSEKAAELRENQVKALLAWLHAGGHLIVGIEQIGDFNASPWLRQVLPCQLTGSQILDKHPELQEWLRGLLEPTPGSPAARDQLMRRYGLNPPPPEGTSPAAANPARPSPLPRPAPRPAALTNLEPDAVFEAAPLPTVTCRLEGGRVVVGTAAAPLVVATDVDRGRVTALLFSPEREPLRSWKNLPWFWTKLAEVPAASYGTPGTFSRYEPSSDGIFGGIVDSRQVRKMPVGWLLLLLVVYLGVIGPFDRWWLKRIGRPMLTWITFPGYVVLFSLLIYFIGYRLRAGETEWNELHVVDVFARGGQAELRGRTYVSIYSPVSRRYRLASPARVATFRGEFKGSFMPQERSGGEIRQQGDSFSAEVPVPVWISRLYVSDWWQSAPQPVGLQVTRRGADLEVTVDNRLNQPLQHVRLAVDGKLVDLGEFPANEKKTLTRSLGQAAALTNFVSQQGARFQMVVDQRRSALGHSASGWIADAPNAAQAASFLSLLTRPGYPGSFITPPGLDLSPLVGRGQAVLLAWSKDYAPLAPLPQFNPRRSHRDTLWRVSCPVTP